MIQILQNIWFQTVAVPLILACIAQGFYLLSKKSAIGATDFSSLPYALGISSLAINAAFAISNPRIVNAAYAWFCLLILIMLVIALFQRLLPWSPKVINIIAIALGVFVLSATFYILQ